MSAAIACPSNPKKYWTDSTIPETSWPNMPTSNVQCVNREQPLSPYEQFFYDSALPGLHFPNSRSFTLDSPTRNLFDQFNVSHQTTSPTNQETTRGTSGSVTIHQDAFLRHLLAAKFPNTNLGDLKLSELTSLVELLRDYTTREEPSSLIPGTPTLQIRMGIPNPSPPDLLNSSRSNGNRLDRSLSLPVGIRPLLPESLQFQQSQLQQQAASRYKTEMCRPFEESGHCKYADKCQFAHGRQELRSLSRHPKYKTELCRTFHSDGFCQYGTRCHFLHDEQARRAYLQEQHLLQEQRKRQLETTGARRPSLQFQQLSQQLSQINPVPFSSPNSVSVGAPNSAGFCDSPFGSGGNFGAGFAAYGSSPESLAGDLPFRTGLGSPLVNPAANFGDRYASIPSRLPLAGGEMNSPQKYRQAGISQTPLGSSGSMFPFEISPKKIVERTGSFNEKASYPRDLFRDVSHWSPPSPPQSIHEEEVVETTPMLCLSPLDLGRSLHIDLPAFKLAE